MKRKRVKKTKKKSLYASTIQVIVAVFGNLGAGLLFLLPATNSAWELFSRAVSGILIIILAIYLNRYDT